MTQQLDPHEIFAEVTESPSLFDKHRFAQRWTDSLLGELQKLTAYLDTLPELADVDEALRALRHLRKQLETS